MTLVLQGAGRCARRPPWARQAGRNKSVRAVRIDIWDDSGGSVVEHVAGADDFQVAEARSRAGRRRADYGCGRASAWCMPLGNGWPIEGSVRSPLAALAAG